LTVPAHVAAQALILSVGIQLCAPTAVEHECFGAAGLLCNLPHGGPTDTEFGAGVAAYADDVEVVLIVVSVNGSCRIECLELAPIGGIVESAYHVVDEHERAESVGFAHTVGYHRFSGVAVRFLIGGECAVVHERDCFDTERSFGLPVGMNCTVGNDKSGESSTACHSARIGDDVTTVSFCEFGKFVSGVCLNIAVEFVTEM